MKKNNIFPITKSFDECRTKFHGTNIVGENPNDILRVGLTSPST